MINNGSEMNSHHRNILVFNIIGVFLVLGSIGLTGAKGQFIERFGHGDTDGWNAFTGDGNVDISLTASDEYATIRVDATRDRHNIWWAVISRAVNSGLNLQELQKADHKLRLEVRVRASHAPRRINLHMFRQGSSDHHQNLMEYDIPDTTNWHTFSLTPGGLQVQPGDTVFAQLALIDWGKQAFELDVDYIKVSVVNIRQAGSDKGTPLAYRPYVPELSSFEHQLMVDHDATVDLHYPETVLATWKAVGRHDSASVMTVNSSQRAIMRWNLESFEGLDVKGWSVLELTPYSVLSNESYEYEELGKVRVSEITGGKAGWEENKVSWSSLARGEPVHEVINPQMILDVEVEPKAHEKLYITIPEPVMQRLIDGKSKGVALQPLGPVQASFYESENGLRQYSPKLYFNTE